MQDGSQYARQQAVCKTVASMQDGSQYARQQAVCKTAGSMQNSRQYARQQAVCKTAGSIDLLQIDLHRFVSLETSHRSICELGDFSQIDL
jgi:hypothetical protein